MTHPPPPTQTEGGAGFRKKLLRTLNLRAGEGRLIVGLGSLLLINSFAIQLSYVASVSGLLENGQALGLPTVWLLSYLLTLGLTSVQLRVIDRYDKRRLLVGVSLIFALLLYAVWWGLNLHLPSVLTYGLLYVIADQQWLIFPLVFWAMCSDVMGMAQAKRLFPIIASLGFIGKILGLTLAWLAPMLAGVLNLNLPGLLLLGFVMYVVAAILSARLSKRSGVSAPPQRKGTIAVTGSAPPLREHGLHFLRLFAQYRHRQPGSLLLRRKWTPDHWQFSAWLRARSGAVVDLNIQRPRFHLESPPAVPEQLDGSRAPALTSEAEASVSGFARKVAGGAAAPGRLTESSSSHRRSTAPPTSDALSIGWQFIQDVPIFKYQALSVFVLAACETILEFVFLFRLEHAFSQADQYQSFYSSYRFLTTLLGFALQMLVTGRMIERLTLRNALSVTAMVLCGVSSTLLLLPGMLSSSLGMGVTRVVRDTIDESSQKSLQAVVPSDKRGRVSLLIDSYILSLGTVLSCLLLLAMWHIAPNWSDRFRLTVLMAAAVLLAGVGVWSVLRLRQVYDSSLLNWRLRRRQRGGDVLERLEF